MDRRTFVSAVAAAAASVLLPRGAYAQPVPKVQNAVLIHGLFADGSCWSEVIARLQAKGIGATAVQNPLTSLQAAVEATQDVLAWQQGPTVLVAHSFGGMILTEAGVDPRVSALVYVAARAPDAGEDYAALASKFPAPPASAGIVWSGTMEGSARKHSCATSPATFQQTRREFCTPSRLHSNGHCFPIRQPTQRGGQSQAFTRYPWTTVRSIRTCSASWPSVWAPRRSRSRRATCP